MKKQILTIVISFVAATMATAQLKVTSTSAVGIGTTTPFTNSKLDIEGNTYIPFGNSYYIGATSDAGNRLRMHHSGSDAYIDYSPNLHFRASTSDALFLSSTGAVGIGTTTPSSLLTVNGTTHFSGATTWDNWTDVYLDWLPPYGVPALYHENDANQDIKQTSICAGYTGLVYIFYKYIG